jgi:Hydrolases of the alpha/beta superfamily
MGLKRKKDMTPAELRRARIRIAVELCCILAVLCNLRLLLPWIVFHPRKDGVEPPPGYAGQGYRDVFLATSDGVRIHCWFVPVYDTAPAARGTVLFFHGNAGNIGDRIYSIETFRRLGMDVLIVDYRGFGRSEGRPTPAGVAQDALAAWRWLTEERRIPPEKILVFGRSVGGAVAMELMRHVRPRALILESTFSSLPEMVRVDALVPLARLLVGDVWNSAEVAASLTVPTLAIHSPNDRIVPYRYGERLYEAVASEKRFVEIFGGHNDGFLLSEEIYIPTLDAFLGKYFGPYKWR